MLCFLVFFSDTSATRTCTLSLHDALPILRTGAKCVVAVAATLFVAGAAMVSAQPEWKAPADAKAVKNPDRKSTRLNSSHLGISYAVFCLKKKMQILMKWIRLTLDRFLYKL